MKKMKNHTPRIVNVRDAAFAYLSVCCSAVAEKPACAMEKGQIVGEFLGSKPAGEGSLGHFRCSVCRKNCKVTRTNKKAVVLETETVHV